MEDDALGGATYDLRTPATARGESITSQFQREILGDAAAAVNSTSTASGAPDTLPLMSHQQLPTTPQPMRSASSATREVNGRDGSAVDEAELFAISTPEALSQKDGQQPQAHSQQPQPPPAAVAAVVAPATAAAQLHDGSRDDRRRTLSPSKALAFFNHEGITDSRLSSSRRDTVSPESIRSLLQGLDGSSARGGSGSGNGGDASSRRASVAAALGLDPTDESIDESVLSDYLHDVARTKQYLETSKLSMLQPSSSSSSSSATTPTKGSKRPRSQDGGANKQRKTNTGDAADQDSFTDAFFSATLLSRDEGGEDEDEDNTIDSISGGVAAKMGEQQRRTTLEPMDAQSILSGLRSELNAESHSTSTTTSTAATTATTATTRQKKASASPSPSPNTRSRRRRTTMDPNDLITMTDGVGAGSSSSSAAVAATTRSANRRETIGDNDLQELQREFGGASGVSETTATTAAVSQPPPRAPTTRSGRVPSPSQDAKSSKRARPVENNSSISGGAAAAMMDVTPLKKTRQLAEDDPLFSPPPTNRTNKTPLKSCMSARKASNKDQPTPSKTVNFGPSQGAEFNLGSPSTSMTPMPARDARAMFPLHEKTPPPSEDDEEEDDDEETSLNTSILDEVDDANDSSNDEGKKEGNDEDDDDDDEDVLMVTHHQQQRQSTQPQLPVSARTRRRFSLRGVSPLDNQANARRQRRMSAAAVSTQSRSPLVSARNRRVSEAASAAVAAAAAAAARASAGPPKSSFLSASQPQQLLQQPHQPHNRLAYADSSASSDEGEDMELTGDYTNHAMTAATLHTGVRRQSHHMSTSDAGSPHLKVRRSARRDSLFADSPLSDTSVELGTLRDLLDESKRDSDDDEKHKKNDNSMDMSGFTDDDPQMQMGSLSDLAKETETTDGAAATTRTTAAGAFAASASQEASQETPLDPIAEGDDEDRRSSSAHSMMSIESDDESDDREYDEKRKTIKVNLSSKFERSVTPKDKKQSTTQARKGESPAASLKKRRLRQLAAAATAAAATSSSPVGRQRTVPSSSSPSPLPLSPAEPPPEPWTTQQVLAKVPSPEISSVAVDAVDVAQLPSDVQRSCVAHATAGDLRFATNEMASWCSGLNDSLSALASEKVSRVFSTENDDAAQSRISQAIQSLQEMEIVHVRSGFCQWRAKLETRICSSLVQSGNNLQSDAKALRSTLTNDRAHRENELRAIKELMERERQMEQLLDGIEEQQAVQREYVASVQVLESACSSLSLEASVMDQRLTSLELSSPQSDRSQATESQLRQDVLALEEVLAVRESIGLWRVLSASASKLVMASRYEDVLFSIDVRVEVTTTSTRSGDGASHPLQSTLRVVESAFFPKTKRNGHIDDRDGRNKASAGDVVSTMAARILNQRQLAEFDAVSVEVSQLPSKLISLSTMLRRAYQYLGDLRTISTTCGLRFTRHADDMENVEEEEDEEDEDHDLRRMLWVDFVRFPRVRSSNGQAAEGLKFSVGHDVTPTWPYTSFEKRIEISYGTVTEDQIGQQIDAISSASPRDGAHEYLQRVCRRLHAVFVQDRPVSEA